MTKRELIQEYANCLKQIKKQCIESGMSEDEFKKLYFKSLASLENNNHSRRRPFTKKFVLIIAIIVTICSVCYLRPVYVNVICYLQELIYPGLRVLRQISIPFISLFPSLTELYHETCLIQNPFFTVVDMDCWPCNTVTNIREIYELKSINQHTAPFTYKTEQTVIKMETLKEKYTRYKEVFDKEASRVLLDNKHYVHPSDMFSNYFSGEKDLYIWKFNTMNVVRILRQNIPRPKVVPKFGQSMERFIVIDSSQNSFHIPDTECNFSFILILSGTRTINLLPAEECKHQCKSFKVELKETYLLWYNWWYWRPEVQSSLSNDTLIAHVGSYC